MQLFFQENITPPLIQFDQEETRHLTKVLRKRIGDLVQVTDGKGHLYECTLKKLDNRSSELEIISTQLQERDNFHIHLIIAPTKSPDRMEWLIEKATEVGFHELTLIQSENSERSRLKLDRLHKKMISACKQSLKFWFPAINESSSFDKVIQDNYAEGTQKFIAHVDEENPNLLSKMAKSDGQYVVLIGPEGDFSSKELSSAHSQDFLSVSLGRSRLRTETAGLIAVHTLQLIQEQG